MIARIFTYRLYTILLVLLMMNGLIAQDIKGYIVTEYGRRPVTFDVPYQHAPKMVDYGKVQSRIKYYDASGAKHWLTPYDASEIILTHGIDTVRLVSVPNVLEIRTGLQKIERFFLRLELDGKMRMFRYYSLNNSPGMYNALTETINSASLFPLESFILQKGSQWVQLKRESFRSDLLYFFEECPDLVQKVQSRELNPRQFADLVRQYNDRCKGM